MKQRVKRALTAVRYRNIFGADIPAVPLSKQAREVVIKPGVPLRAIVVSSQALKTFAIGQQGSHGGPENLLYLWNASGISTTQEMHVRRVNQRLVDIIHQGQDA